MFVNTDMNFAKGDGSQWGNKYNVRIDLYSMKVARRKSISIFLNSSEKKGGVQGRKLSLTQS